MTETKHSPTPWVERVLIAPRTYTVKRNGAIACGSCFGSGRGIIGGTCFWCGGSGVDGDGWARREADERLTRFLRGVETMVKIDLWEHPWRDPGD